MTGPEDRPGEEERCEGCGQMVSTSTCCCGEPIKGHVGDAHHSTAIPYGCKCYTASWER